MVLVSLMSKNETRLLSLTLHKTKLHMSLNMKSVTLNFAEEKIQNKNMNSLAQERLLEQVTDSIAQLPRQTFNKLGFMTTELL